MPYDKDITGIQYKPFVDYKIDTASDKLPLPSDAYWHTLDDILTKYVMNNDNKFDYGNEGIAHRKRIVAHKIKYIGKESSNLENNFAGIVDPYYLEFSNDHEIVKSEDFKQWILSLKPKDVIDKGILKRTLYKTNYMIKKERYLTPRLKLLKFNYDYIKIQN